MSELQLRRFETVQEFEDVALPFLLKREAEHNVILGICSRIKRGEYSEFWLAAVMRGADVVAAAYRTPPFILGLSHVGDPAAIELISGSAREAFDALPGVSAPKVDSIRFCEAWSAVSGQSFSLRTEQRIYQATAVRKLARSPGRTRPATERDAELLGEWVIAFGGETNAPLMSPLADWVANRLRQDDASGVWVWENEDDVVSMAAYVGPTPNGIRVNGVYTPPEHRGRGYASACVAALTEWLLNGGRRFCFLYTDLANPTSNKIYQQIGYEPVCDVDQYMFA